MPSTSRRGRSRTVRAPKRSLFVKSSSSSRSTQSAAPAKRYKVVSLRSKPPAPRKVAAPKTQGSQMGYKSTTMTLAKPMSRGAMTAKLTQSMLETVMLRWNGVKAFSGNGNYWMQNRVVSGVRRLPWYMMDLTTVNNMVGTPPTISRGQPMVQMVQNTLNGNIYFDTISGLLYDGVSSVSYFWPEKAPTKLTASTADTTDMEIAPFGKSMIQSASISANLWGATAKATKYMVQVVRITDEELVPNHVSTAVDLTQVTPKRNDFYQNMIKSWTFNPIATTGGLQARKYKVLKTQTITIEPNPTTDGDADPQCVVYKAFLKLNKICKYEETAAFLTTDADTNDQADYAVNTGAQITNQVNPTSRIYLVIRATNYGADAGDTNVQTPSFDLSVRIKHTIPK